MAKAKDKFPKQLFVGLENQDTEEDVFFIAQETADGLEVSNDERAIAIYQLVRVTKIINTSEVV